MDLKPRWLGQTIDAADIFSTYCTSESKNQDRLTNVSIICVRCETSCCFLGGMRSYLYHNKYEEPWQGSGCETVAIRKGQIHASRADHGMMNLIKKHLPTSFVVDYTRCIGSSSRSRSMSIRVVQKKLGNCEVVGRMYEGRCWRLYENHLRTISEQG